VLVVVVVVVVVVVMGWGRGCYPGSSSMKSCSKVWVGGRAKADQHPKYPLPRNSSPSGGNTSKLTKLFPHRCPLLPLLLLLLPPYPTTSGVVVDEGVPLDPHEFLEEFQAQFDWYEENAGLSPKLKEGNSIGSDNGPGPGLVKKRSSGMM